MGELLGLPANGVGVAGTVEEALHRPADVVVDYTSPDSVKARVLEVLARGVRVAHVLGPGRADRHTLRPWAHVEGTRVTYPPASGELFTAAE